MSPQQGGSDGHDHGRGGATGGAIPPPPPPPPPPPSGGGLWGPAGGAVPPAPPISEGGRLPLLDPARIRSLARWTEGLLWTVLVVDLLTFGIGAATGRTEATFMGEPGSSPVLGAGDGLWLLLTLVASIPGIALIVVFLVWQHRSHLQVTAARGPHALRFGPGFAVGAWFIPFVNFVVPLLEIRDLFRASATPADRASVPGYLAAWWATLFVIPAIVTVWTSSLTFRAIGDGDRPVATLTALDGVSTFSRLVAAVLAVRLVRELTGRLDRLVSAQP